MEGKIILTNEAWVGTIFFFFFNSEARFLCPPRTFAFNSLRISLTTQKLQLNFDFFCFTK